MIGFPMSFQRGFLHLVQRGYSKGLKGRKHGNLVILDFMIYDFIFNFQFSIFNYIRIFASTYLWGRRGFDSMKNRYVSMSGAVKRPVNPGHKNLIGENNYALAA